MTIWDGDSRVLHLTCGAVHADFGSDDAWKNSQTLKLILDLDFKRWILFNKFPSSQSDTVRLIIAGYYLMPGIIL